MKRFINLFICALTAVSLLSACSGDGHEKQAADWLDEAKALYEKGDYTKAIAAIDSLRANFPKDIENRKAALKLYQQISVKAAQQTVEHADKDLQEVNKEYEAMKVTVEDLKSRGEATAEQLTRLTLLRMKRDSLQTVFDVECAKIKYIKARMNENQR